MSIGDFNPDTRIHENAFAVKFLLKTIFLEKILNLFWGDFSGTFFSDNEILGVEQS